MTTTVLGDQTKAPTFHPIAPARKVKNTLAALFFGGPILIATIPLGWLLY
ncbi:MAG: phosphate ABC transporter, permease protein PstA, partial [Mycobacterium sp.]|nr:phosphate ABC transporter, permease protein PstA [Mycobacterium sp.]